MNGLENEIRQHIDRNNKEMLELLTFDHFTLNKRVHELMKEINLIKMEDAFTVIMKRRIWNDNNIFKTRLSKMCNT